MSATPAPNSRLQLERLTCSWLALRLGSTDGQGEIRTHGTGLTGTPVFETGAFNHSATCPTELGKIARYPLSGQRDASTYLGCVWCKCPATGNMVLHDHPTRRSNSAEIG